MYGEKRGFMKLLIINGSPKNNGNTARALAEAEAIFTAEGIEVENIHVGDKMIRGCIACQACKKTGKCAIDDLVNAVAPKFEECDGILIGSPVHYAAPAATLIAFLDRLFYSTKFDKMMKVGAAIVVARRGGCSSAFDQLNKYFGISGMPVAASQYWNSVHGAIPGEVENDAEGLQTMRTLAHNMAFLMKAIALGKEKYGLPEREKPERTNFIR